MDDSRSLRLGLLEPVTLDVIIRFFRASAISHLWKRSCPHVPTVSTFSGPTLFLHLSSIFQVKLRSSSVLQLLSSVFQWILFWIPDCKVDKNGTILDEAGKNVSTSTCLAYIVLLEIHNKKTLQRFQESGKQLKPQGSRKTTWRTNDQVGWLLYHISYFSVVWSVLSQRFV